MSENGATLEPWLREILRCPACRTELTDVTEAAAVVGFHCAACARTYPVVDGIPVLLIDQAVTS